jgi:prophage antirepressor-like protein
LHTPGGPQRVRVLSESGLYKLLMRSYKPEAHAFQDWVTRDVLPAIRKEGVYVVGEEKLAAPDLSISDLNAINDHVQALLKRKAEILEARVTQLQPRTR